MVCPPSDDEKTTVLDATQETLRNELQAAKEHGACFIVIRGARQGHRFIIDQHEMTLGRDPSAEISIDDPSISRKHARITKTGENEYSIMDTGSSNGTVVNGKTLEKNQPVILQKEDMVKIGSSILKFLPAGEIEILFYGKMEDAAHTDALTRIYNKGYLIEALDAEFKRAKALHQDFALLFFDIDHFKKINDTHGHDAGDYILKEFTRIIATKHLEEKEVFGRYGGEEFIILSPGKNNEQAEKLGEDIRATIEAHPFIYEGTRIQVTASIGICNIDSSIETSQTLLKKADAALYESKENGRNQVSVA
tara:strand:+ start:6734 stop:7657 length:924 start_codon:yes stop_codon:yes gene_type:complete